MSGDDRDTLARLGRQLADLDGSIKEAEKAGTAVGMAHMPAMRDEYEPEINKLRDSLGYQR